MRLHFSAIAAPVLALFLMALGTACSPEADHEGLIPRESFFSEPERYQLRISPDGNHLSYVATADGNRSIWVAERSDLNTARVISKHADESVYQHYWAATSDAVLYSKHSKDGNSRHLFVTHLNTGETINLTPFENTYARIVKISHSHPDEILVSVHKYNNKSNGLYRINIRTGKRRQIARDERFLRYFADESLFVKLAALSDHNGKTVFTRAGGEWKTKIKISSADAFSFGIVGFDKTGRYAYMLDSRGRDTAALKRFDTTTGQSTLVAADTRADIEDVLLNPETGDIEAYSSVYEKRQWIALNTEFADTLNSLKSQAGAAFEVLDRSRDGRYWVVYVEHLNRSNAYYVFDAQENVFTRQFFHRPNLEGVALAPMESHLLKARDGTELVSYLTRPQGEYGLKQSVSPAPMVLLVHGGPWRRDTFGNNILHPWLANRGYAVLSVNYRGSSGFGKTFLDKGDHEWGAKIQDDLVDAVRWAVDEGIADEDRIAIAGGGFGGFAALSALANTPNLFACAVSASGPPNLITYINTVPPHWTSMKNMMAARVGNPATREGQIFLERRSPLFKTGAMVQPLLIFQGGKDERVKRSETEQIIASFASRDVPFTYVLFPQDGHRLRKARHEMAYYATFEAFLGQCLGGKVESINNVFKNADMELVQGGNYVPGLQNAVENR